MRRSFLVMAVAGTLCAATAIGVCGCTIGTSAVAGSTHGKASVYRSATAYVQLAPEQVFKPAVKILLERGDIEITDLKEANNRCEAVFGDRKLTFRVIESSDGRSRMSMLVGGGDDPEANQELANELIQRICAPLSMTCDFGTNAP